MSASERPSEAALWRTGWRLVAGYVPYVLRGRRRTMAIVIGSGVALLAAGGILGFDTLRPGETGPVVFGAAALAAFGGALMGVAGTIGMLGLLDIGSQVPSPRADPERARALRRDPETAALADDATLRAVTASLWNVRAASPATVVTSGLIIGLGILIVASTITQEGRVGTVGWVWIASLVLITAVQIVSVRVLGLADWRLSIIEPVARERFGRPVEVADE